MWVFSTRFLWIRVLTEDQAVYLLPKSGCINKQGRGKAAVRIEL